MTGLASTGVASTSLAITGAHVVPIDGEPFDGTVLVAGGRIAALGPADIGFDDALAGGITTANVNPGSGNAIGGLTVAVHTHGRTVDEMVLRSPSGLKSALGENPKRVYGDKKQTPSTRLGTAAVIRRAFVEAQNYLDRFANTEPGKPTRQGISRTKRSAGCCAARSPGGSTRTAPTTPPPRSGSPTSSATGW
jgi:imidazolonepropionase-like amidohydrolase